MNSDKFHYISPKNYRLFGSTLGLITICHLGLSLYYGDIRQVQGMTVVLLISTFQYFVAPSLSRNSNEIFLHTVNLISVALVKLTMTEGTSGAPLYIAFSLSTVTFSSRNTIAYSIMIAGAVLILSLDYLGSIGGVVPPRLSMAVSLSLFGLYTYLFVGAANRRRLKANKKLHETECALLERQNEIQAQRAELLKANTELQHQASLLDEQLARATQVTKSLAIRREDEDELVRAMHHDLREPLRSMISFNQLVARKILKHGDKPELNTFLEFARDAGVRMDRMLADLLTFSKTSTSSALALTSLEMVVDKAKMNLSALIESSSAQISIGQLPEVMGVETQMIQLYQNLIANSIKYSKPGVPAIIDVSGYILKDGKIRVEVSDNGIGIAKEEQKRIFNLFSRVESVEGNQSGSGVGLALCRSITLSHNAKLSLQSEVGHGSCFSTTFPSPKSTTINQNQLVNSDVKLEKTTQQQNQR